MILSFVWAGLAALGLLCGVVWYSGGNVFGANQELLYSLTVTGGLSEMIGVLLVDIFDTAKAFDHIQIQPEGAVVTGDEYPCVVTFEVRQPTAIFEMTRHDTAGTVLESGKFSPEQVEDISE